MSNVLKELWKDEDGVGVVEIILILVILIMIIVIFREQIIDIVSKAFKQIKGDTTTINKKITISK